MSLRLAYDYPIPGYKNNVKQILLFFVEIENIKLDC